MKNSSVTYEQRIYYLFHRKEVFFLAEAFKRVCAKQALAHWIITETTSAGVQEYNTYVRHFTKFDKMLPFFAFLWNQRPKDLDFTKDKILKEWVYFKVNQVETQKTFISYKLDTEDVDKTNMQSTKSQRKYKFQTEKVFTKTEDAISLT